MWKKKFEMKSIVKRFLKDNNTQTLVYSGKPLKELDLLERLKYLTSECFIKKDEDTFARVEREVSLFLTEDEDDEDNVAHFNDLVEELQAIVKEKLELSASLI